MINGENQAAKILNVNIGKPLGRFICNTAILLLFWGGLIRKSFNSDTLAHMMSPDGDVAVRMAGGRYIPALIDKILFMCGKSTTTNISVTILLAIVIFAATIVILESVFVRFEPQNHYSRIAYYFALSLFVLNVFFSEMLMFAEFSVYFALAYFFAASGICFFSKKKYVITVVFLIFSVCTYQYSAIFAAIILLFYVILDYDFKITSKAILSETAVIAACGGLGIANIISYKILFRMGLISYMEKSDGVGNIGDKIKLAAQSFLKIIRNAYNLIPVDWIHAMFFLLFILTALIVMVRCAGEIRVKIFWTIITTMMSYVLIYIIPVIEDEFYYPPRLAFAYYLVQGLFIMACLSVFDSEIKGGTIANKVMVAALFLYLFLQLMVGHFIVIDRFVSNSLDRECACEVEKAISEYEAATGNTVTKMGIAHDEYTKPKYSQVQFYYEQINERTIAVVPVSTINAFTGRNLAKVDMDSNVFEQYFAGKDWEYLNTDEQLVFIDDTVYWCVY